MSACGLYFEVEPPGFAVGLDVGCEGGRGIKDTS